METHKHPKLANGQPAICCFALSPADLARRVSAAHERACALLAQQPPASPAEAAAERAHLSRYQLWHEDFTLGLKLLVCDTPLYRLTADLPGQLQAANGEQPLDFWDYAYLADVLRELLTSHCHKGDRLHLRRALAWVEQQGQQQQREDAP